MNNKPTISLREYSCFKVPTNVFIYIESKKMYMFVDEIEKTKDSVIFKSHIHDGKEHTTIDYRRNKNKTVFVVENYSISPIELDEKDFEIEEEVFDDNEE